MTVLACAEEGKRGLGDRRVLFGIKQRFRCGVIDRRELSLDLAGRRLL